jgi:hypothetical protein
MRGSASPATTGSMGGRGWAEAGGAPSKRHWCATLVPETLSYVWIPSLPRLGPVDLCREFSGLVFGGSIPPASGCWASARWASRFWHGSSPPGTGQAVELALVWRMCYFVGGSTPPPVTLVGRNAVPTPTTGRSDKEWEGKVSGNLLGISPGSPSCGRAQYDQQQGAAVDWRPRLGLLLGSPPCRTWVPLTFVESSRGWCLGVRLPRHRDAGCRQVGRPGFGAVPPLQAPDRL